WGGLVARAHARSSSHSERRRPACNSCGPRDQPRRLHQPPGRDMTGTRLARSAIAVIVVEVLTVAGAPAAAADPPGAGIVRNVIGDGVGWAWDKVAGGIATWVLGGVAYLTDGVVNFLKTSASPDIGAAWFAGPG